MNNQNGVGSGGKSGGELDNCLNKLTLLKSEIIRLKNEVELREKERDFISSRLDAGGTLVIILDVSGCIVRFNWVCEKVTGYSQDEVKGRPIWEMLLVPEEVEPVMSVFNSLKEGRFPSEFENYWKTKTGELRYIKWFNTSQLGNEGEVEYIIGNGVDITEQKRREEERETLVLELQRARAEVELLRNQLGNINSDED